MKQHKLPFIEKLLFYSLLFFLPTQLGKHFWPEFSYVLGLRIDYLSPTLFVTDVIIALLLVVWIWRKISLKKTESMKQKLWKRKSVLLFMIAFSYLLINSLLSGRVLGGLYYLLKFLEMSFVAYYTAKFMASENVSENTAQIFAGGALFQSFLVLAQFVRQGSIGGILYFLGERSFTASTPGIANASLNGELVLRPYGTLPHPNVLAGYLLVAMTWVLFFFRRRQLKKEAGSKRHDLWFSHSLFIIQIMSLILGSIALALSMSRIVLVLWGAILFYFFAGKLKKKFVIALCICIGLVVLATPLGSRFTGVHVADEAVSQRIALMSAAAKMFASSPLLGVGLSNFIPSLAVMLQQLTASTYLQPVHNIFLLVASETGIIGLGLFVWLLWKTFCSIKKQEAKIKEPLLLVFVAILLTGLFDHYWLTLQQGQLLFAFIAGVCWADSRKNNSAI